VALHKDANFWMVLRRNTVTLPYRFVAVSKAGVFAALEKTALP
jgi:hypothetical protein